MASDRPPFRVPDRGSAWWRLRNFQVDQVVRPGSGYAFDNRGRGPAGLVIVQFSLAGAVRFRCPDGERTVAAGQAVCFAYGDESDYHLPEHAGAYRCSHACLVGAGLREHCAEMRARFGPVIEFDRSLYRRFLELTATLHDDDLPGQAARVHALLAAYWRLAERGSGRAPVELAIDALLADPCHPWSLKELGDRHGVSREHLSRRFRERVGMPPATWLRRARLEKVRGLLEDSELTVDEIAHQCGIGSGHTLARLLRRETGRSPRQFAPRHRRPGPPGRNRSRAP